MYMSQSEQWEMYICLTEKAAETGREHSQLIQHDAQSVWNEGERGAIIWKESVKLGSEKDIILA